MIKKRFFLFSFVAFCAAVPCRSQNAVKVGIGASASSMRNSMDLGIGIFDRNLWACSPFVGVDWLGHKYCYLSSEIRYVRIGGGDMVYTDATEESGQEEIKISWDYIQLNTTFRLQYPLRRMSLYAGAGMFLNGRVSGAGSEFYSDVAEARAVGFGEIFEGGVTTVCGRLKMDLNVSYSLSNGHIARLGYTKFYPDVWTVSLSAGYVL